MPAKQNNLLQEILDLLEKGSYEKSFRLCKKYLDIKEDPALYYFASLSLFGLGHIHQSEEYIEKHGILSEYGTTYLYLAAYLELHKGHFDRSLLYWTRIVSIDPSDTFADPLIEELKKSKNNLQSQLLIPTRFHHFVPIRTLQLKSSFNNKKAQIKKEKPRKNFFQFLNIKIILITFILLASLASFYYINETLVIWNKITRVVGLAKDDLPGVPTSGSVTHKDKYKEDRPEFFYSDRLQAIDDYKRARELILNKKSNQARYLLGKLELSNASFEIKERALQLRSAIPRNNKSDFSDHISINKILDQPYIYRGAEIILKGELEDEPDSVENIQRFMIQVAGQESRQFLVLYDFGPQSGNEKLKGLKKGMALEIFGVFHNKKNKKAIIHAWNVNKTF